MKYKTNIWRYKSKKPKAALIVFARERKTADEIVDVENTENLFILKPARFFFRRSCTIDVPPYELEALELETAKARLDRRREYFRQHPERRKWLANQCLKN